MNFTLANPLARMCCHSVYTEFLPFFAAGCSILRVVNMKSTPGASGDPSVTSSSDTLLDTAEK